MSANENRSLTNLLGRYLTDFRFYVLTWFALVVLWLYSFPMIPSAEWDLMDIIAEGVYLLIAILTFIVVRKLCYMVPGWGVFVLGLWTDWLDEILCEPAIQHGKTDRIDVSIQKQGNLLVLELGCISSRSS